MGKQDLSRMLNAKVRTIGIDSDELDRMVEEHKQLQEVEKAEDFAEAEKWKEINRLRSSAEFEDLKLQLAENRALADEWRAQKYSPRKEADLNPRSVKMQTINPDLCAPGAAQLFAGEDVGYQQRLRAQKKQMADYCSAEAERKAAIRKAERDEDMAELEKYKIIDSIRATQEFQSRQEEQAQIYELQQYNRLLAKEKQMKEKQERLMDQNINNWEMQNALQDPMLAEDPSQYTGSHLTRRRDHWKGMSHKEVAEIYQYNAQQIEEAKAAKQEEKDADKQWASYYAETDKSVFEMQAVVHQEHMDARYALAAEQEIQKKQHRKKELGIKKDLGMNTIDAKFYGSFGRGL